MRSVPKIFKTRFLKRILILIMIKFIMIFVMEFATRYMIMRRRNIKMMKSRRERGRRRIGGRGGKEHANEDEKGKWKKKKDRLKSLVGVPTVKIH